MIRQIISSSHIDYVQLVFQHEADLQLQYEKTSPTPSSVSIYQRLQKYFFCHKSNLNQTKVFNEKEVLEQLDHDQNSSPANALREDILKPEENMKLEENLKHGLRLNFRNSNDEFFHIISHMFAMIYVHMIHFYYKEIASKLSSLIEFRTQRPRM
jgi:hypothetical protein